VPRLLEGYVTDNENRAIPEYDLEEMARQMRAFQDLTRELDAIIDSSSDGLWICDAEARVIWINPA
jgi:PAS domain-containing protein